MKTILVAPDSFKGSIGAIEAARAIARGIRNAARECEILECPLSDGGEGFLKVLAPHGGTWQRVETVDAFERPITAPYLLWDDTVLVELASAAGLQKTKDPKRATTYGVGLMIKKAFERHHFRKLVLSLGGSATIDGGAGLLEALGIRLLDPSGKPIPRGGAGLLRSASVEKRKLPFEVTLALDVENPLLGPRGAARVYGPQKGARPEEIPLFEEGLERLATLFSVDPTIPGLGAAGGVPIGLVSLGARLVSGFEWLAEKVGLGLFLARSDWVISGEGRVDPSSFEGKVVGRLFALCDGKLKVIAGTVAPEAVEWSRQRGLLVLPLAEDLPVEERIQRVETLLVERAEELAHSLLS